MLNKFNDTNSIIKKINPVLKLLSLIFMTIESLFTNSYIDIIILSSYLILCYTFSNIKINLVKNFYSKLIIILIVLLSALIISNSFNSYMFNLFKFLFIIIYVYIFKNTVSSLEIIYSSYKILDPIKKIIRIDLISYILVLIIKYLSLPIKEYQRIKNIQNIKYKSFSKKINNIYKNIKLSIYFTNIKINKTIDILKLKLYGYNKSRTSYYSYKNKLINNIFTTINICIIIIAIYY